MPEELPDYVNHALFYGTGIVERVHAEIAAMPDQNIELNDTLAHDTNWREWQRRYMEHLQRMYLRIQQINNTRLFTSLTSRLRKKHASVGIVIRESFLADSSMESVQAAVVAQLRAGGVDLKRILTFKVEALPDIMCWKLCFIQHPDAPLHYGQNELEAWLERMKVSTGVPHLLSRMETPEFLHPGEEQ